MHTEARIRRRRPLVAVAATVALGIWAGTSLALDPGRAALAAALGALLAILSLAVRCRAAWLAVPAFSLLTGCLAGAAATWSAAGPFSGP